MVKPELGNKRVCVSCSTRFYDLGKSPAICPKCGTEQPVEQPRLRRSVGNPPEERRAKKPVPAPGAEEPDLEVEGAEESEDVLEDTSDLEDDADAIGPDIEVEQEPDEGDR